MEALGIVGARVVGSVASGVQHSFRRDALDLQAAMSIGHYSKACIAISSKADCLKSHFGCRWRPKEMGR